MSLWNLIHRLPARSSQGRAPLSLGLMALLGLMVGGLPGCDNPVCVFADGCTGTGGDGGTDPDSLGDGTARFPGPGAIMRGGDPEFVAAGPGGDAANTMQARSPIFLEFSESLNPDTLFNLASGQSAFQVIETSFQQPFIMQPPILVGDGRVVVLLPSIDYQEGGIYQVFFSEDQQITDLNGQTIAEPTIDPLITITVDSAASADTPRLIYAYPSDRSINNANTSEIVVGFDRQMDATTIDDASFVVTVGGAAPTFDPAPTAISSSFMGQSVPNTQVFTWSPIENGEVQPYGTDAQVVVQLSQGSERILSEGGDALPSSETDFTTTDFSLPAAVAKVAGARPEGAFGIADITGGAPIVEVTMATAPPGGTVAEFYLFGQSPINGDIVRSAFRTVDIPGGATSLQVTADQLQLSDNQNVAIFADGIAQVAVQLRNGNGRSSARRFDANPATADIDDPFFDTTTPVLLGLGGSGADTSQLFGEVREFAAFGRASEPIAFAFVSTMGSGDNGGSLSDPPAVAFSTPSNEADEAFFMAAPVSVGVLDPAGAGVSYEVTVYDQAFNAATLTAMGTFRHRGVVGPGVAPSGAAVSVTVFNEETLELVEGALVFSHQEVGGAVTFVDSDTSSAAGVASVNGAGAGATVITVDAPGFDLFTFHGVPRNVVEIPLTPSGSALATVQGTVVGAFQSGLLATNNVAADSRATSSLGINSVSGCAATGGFTGVECNFGPIVVTPGKLGGVAILGTNENIEQAQFSPLMYLLTYALAAPFGPVPSGGSALGLPLDVGSALAVGGASVQAVTIVPHALNLNAATNFGPISGDPTVYVEAAATGLAGPLTVGRGKPFSTGANTWTVLGATPGVAASGGALETRGAIDPDLYLRASAVDMAGNVVTARPRFSISMGLLVPSGVPRLLSPAPGSMTGGSSYNLLVADIVPDVATIDGIYRATLSDSAGRAWTVVGLDSSDAAGDIVLSLPAIGADGGVPLAGGLISASVEAYGLVLDRGLFMWSDIARENLLSGRAASVDFTQN